MRFLIPILLIATLYSCTSQHKADLNSIGNLPKVVSVDDLKNTDFVPTMENHIYSGKNIIYCPTLLYTWDEIKKITGDLRVQEDKDNRDLIQLNESTAHQNSLVENEYKSQIEVLGDVIKGSVEFNIELTFKTYLEQLEQPLMFKNTKVKGFGMTEFDFEIVQQMKILYFKDNNNFIFKINPEQYDNEIFFIMGTEFSQSKTFAEIVAKMKESILIGENERKNGKNTWKYFFKEHETFAIPEIAFNIEKSFNRLENQTVYNDKKSYLIKNVKQRNALLLNNKGAKIESEAEILVATVEVPTPMEDKTIEKHLLLNNTFYIVFKHNSKQNPYMCIKVETDELMKKYAE